MKIFSIDWSDFNSRVINSNSFCCLRISVKTICLSIVYLYKIYRLMKYGNVETA